MIFHVGPWAYRVRITEEPLVSDQGRESYGLCEWVSRTIWMAASLPVRRRLAVFVHELKHAWQFEFGRPQDDEADATQAAAFTIDVMRQLERNGGEPALMRLGVDGIVDQSVDLGIIAEPRCVQCPKCGGYLELPIKDGTPTFDPLSPRLVMWRSAVCEHCRHTVSWRESCTLSGVPTAAVIGPPIIQTSAALATSP